MIFLIYSAGTTGYYILQDDFTPLDALYMTTITLATVGFQEVRTLNTPTRVFTIILIFGGISTLGYALTTITSVFVEGQLRHTFRDRKMENAIKKMKNHVILCGHGRLGSQAAKELHLWHQQYVVIERDREMAEKLRENNIPCVHGNATEDDVLIAAGVKNARGLIAALAHDTDNLFVTLSARRLNTNLEIVSRAEYESSEVKLFSAGANKVLLPTKVAGRRMACMLINPEVASFLDVLIETDEMDLSLQQLIIPEGSLLDDVLISEAKMPRNIRIIGLKLPGQKMIVNPPASFKLNAGNILILLGESSEIEEYRQTII